MEVQTSCKKYRAAPLPPPKNPEITPSRTPRRCFELDAEVLELEDRYFAFAERVEVVLEIHRALEHYQVDAQIRFGIRGECCRCLVPVTL